MTGTGRDRAAASGSPADGAGVMAMGGSMDELRLRRAGIDDIPFVMVVERLPGYGRLVGRWSEAEHRAALASPDTAYLIAAGEAAGAVTAGGGDAGEARFVAPELAGDADGHDATAGPAAGFVILRGIGEGSVGLQRVAVTRPGAGFGSRLLAAAVDWVWRETDARRLWLDVARHNARARHVYGKLGFVEEGVHGGEHRLPDGGTVELVVMGMVRPEREARSGDLR